MPNRILKESIRTSDIINDLSWFEEVLYYRLIVSCDDYGRFDGRTAIIKGTCFPLKDVTTKNIENALSKLVSAGLVRHYTVEGKPYLSLSGWERHQNIRAKKSKYPSPDELSEEDKKSCMQMNTDENICMQMNTDVPVIQSNTKSESYSKTYTGDVRVDAAVHDFVEHRKKLKKPMTEKAVELFCKRLEKLADTPDEKIALINQAIERGWQTVYPLKDDTPQSKSKKTKFSNFTERKYDYAALENALFEKQLGGRE